jgi:hypothetical protein
MPCERAVIQSELTPGHAEPAARARFKPETARRDGRRFAIIASRLTGKKLGGDLFAKRSGTASQT